MTEAAVSNPISSKQLRAIWAGASNRGLVEEALRDLVEAETGQRSTRRLDKRQAGRIIDRLCGKKEVEPKRFADCDGRKGMATGKQLRKIEAMWKSVARDPSDQALRAWLTNRWKVSDLRFLKRRTATSVITALEKF